MSSPLRDGVRRVMQLSNLPLCLGAMMRVVTAFHEGVRVSLAMHCTGAQGHDPAIARSDVEQSLGKATRSNECESAVLVAALTFAKGAVSSGPAGDMGQAFRLIVAQ